MAQISGQHLSTLVRSLTSYYTLLCQFPYLPPSAIEHPSSSPLASSPPPTSSPPSSSLLIALSKTPGVTLTLQNLPYLSNQTISTYPIFYETHALDWRNESRLEKAIAKLNDENWTPGYGSALAQVFYEPLLQRLTKDTIALTTAGNYGRWWLLNVEEGTITDFSLFDGPQPGPKVSDEDREMGSMWKHYETRSIEDFFQTYEAKLRLLDVIPVPSPDGMGGSMRSSWDTDLEEREVCSFSDLLFAICFSKLGKE